MPCCERRAVDQRLRLVLAVLSGELTMTQSCEVYGFSRKSGYKWKARYEAEGPAGLVDRSHAPLNHGQATDASLVEAIIALKLLRPS